MDTLHRSPSYHRSRRHRKGPPIVGRLIDLYLSTHTYVVKTKYLLSDSMTVEDQVQYQELRVEILNNEIQAIRIFQTLKLPRWRSLPEDLRQVFIMAAVGSLGNGFAVTCNVGPRAAKRASEASRGPADYIGRKLRGLISIAPELAIVLEDADNRRGCNPGLHFHAALRMSTDQVAALEAVLLKLFASDYVEVAGNQAVFIKPIREPGSWGSYCCKTLLKPNQVDKAVFATQAASRAGEQLYNKTMRWIRELPAPELLQAELDGLLRQLVPSRPCPELCQLIRHHAERRSEARRLRRKQARDIKQLAAANPDQIMQELVSIFRSASERSYTEAFVSPVERADEEILNKRDTGSTQRSIALTERYSEVPSVGIWASNEQDDVPLMGLA